MCPSKTREMEPLKNSPHAHALANRVAVITGGSSGIGRATAVAFAARGARVAVVARRADRLNDLVAQLDKLGCKSLACVADVSSPSEMRSVAQEVLDNLGRGDILVNNAGVMLSTAFANAESKDWEIMVRTNLIGPMECTAAFLPQLTNGGGDIVNISSVGGRKARPTTSIYNATKWGVNGWSEALRQELCQQNIRVIVIEPGAVKTELLDHFTDARIQDQSRRHFEEVGALSPEDVADCIAFAVSLDRRISLNEMLIRPTRQQY